MLQTPITLGKSGGFEMSRVQQLEKTCEAYNSLCSHILVGLKQHPILIEDVIAKTQKLHATLKLTLSALNGFFTSIQSLADSASSSRGATAEWGATLTLLTRRQQGMESSLHEFSSALDEHLISGLRPFGPQYRKEQESLTKHFERTRDRARAEVRTANSRKHSNKKNITPIDLDEATSASGIEARQRHESMLNDWLKKLLLVERMRFCTIYNKCMRPVLNAQLDWLQHGPELTRLVDVLDRTSENAEVLPSSSAAVVSDIKATACGTNLLVKPSSPTLPLSRKASLVSVSSSGSDGSSQIMSSGDSGFSEGPPEKPRRRGSVRSEEGTMMWMMRQSRSKSQDREAIKDNLNLSASSSQNSSTDTLDEGCNKSDSEFPPPPPQTTSEMIQRLEASLKASDQQSYALMKEEHKPTRVQRPTEQSFRPTNLLTQPVSDVNQVSPTSTFKPFRPRTVIAQKSPTHAKPVETVPPQPSVKCQEPLGRRFSDAGLGSTFGVGKPLVTPADKEEISTFSPRRVSVAQCFETKDSIGSCDALLEAKRRLRKTGGFPIPEL
uniref:Mtss-1 n=1 Tax=Hofstenia miamia TaxID=442651 RepID=A0A8K1V878_HOFMI|nr:mtss-1 [Hofstenia miamia]